MDPVTLQNPRFAILAGHQGFTGKTKRLSISKKKKKKRNKTNENEETNKQKSRKAYVDGASYVRETAKGREKQRKKGLLFGIRFSSHVFAGNLVQKLIRGSSRFRKGGRRG